MLRAALTLFVLAGRPIPALGLHVADGRRRRDREYVVVDRGQIPDVVDSAYQDHHDEEGPP